MPRDNEWMLTELKGFVEATNRRSIPDPPGMVFLGGRTTTQASSSEVVARATVVERIVSEILPNWQREILPKRGSGSEWSQLREASQRAITLIEREKEIEEKLGDGAPTIPVSQVFHPWVWESAKSLWKTGHFRESILAAATVVNAEAQSKIGRRSLSEGSLFKEAFSLNGPTSERLRLRIQPDDGGETYKNVHKGAMAYADGWFTAVRNPIAHEAKKEELNEAEAFRLLAALSVLAYWVDRAEVVREKVI